MEILPSVYRFPNRAYTMMNWFYYKKTSTESACQVEKVEVKYWLWTHSSQTSKSNHWLSLVLFLVRLRLWTARIVDNERVV